ncbi:S8 family serine peptidase [Marinobacter sp. C2H3]|uniref:S8 family serine peptidase n=1 Tax=Marinobacter sp. C2H3 TaxID=3119003 RepID=UPI00300ED127
MNGYKVWRSAGVLVLLPVALAGCGGGGGSSSGGDTPAPSAAVAGQIDIEANTRVDIDTAEKLSVTSGFLGTASPQSLPGSVILGGYVSGQSGSRNVNDPNDDYARDPVDRYQLTVSAGDRIELQTFYTYYYDAAGTPVEANFPVSLTLRNPSDGSVVTNTMTQTTSPGTQVYSVSIDVPTGTATGSYYVDVEAGSGPMRYVLTTSPSGGVTSLSFDWPRYNFVRDEALVTFGGSVNARAMASTLSASPVRELGQGTWLMRRNAAQTLSAGSAPEQTAQWIQALRAQPGVASAVPNYVVNAQAPSPDPLYSKQWHYPLINVPAAWQLAPGGGNGVTVAVVDTGLFRDRANGQWHPDLNAHVPQVSDPRLIGSDFVSQTDLDNDDVNTTFYGKIGRDNIPADPGSTLGTNVFHGTHVAGTIAALKDNGIGGTGVAFSATLLPVRVLGEGGSGSLGDLVDGLNWIADNDNADIVNLSLGGLPYVSSLETALKRLNDRGITTVAAAGNSATSTKEYPAASQYAIAVSAVDGAGNLAPYSNFGSWIDVAAPGGSAADANLDGSPDLVLSTSATLGDSGQFEPSYRGLVGTSMAAPHVSGVFALMQEASTTAISPGQFRAWLMAGELTQDGDGSRNDQLGYGLIDAARAVSKALNGGSTTVVSPDPYFVSLNNQKTEDVVTLNRIGDLTNPLTNCVFSSPAWLKVTCDDAVDPAELTVALIDPSSLNPDAPLKGSVSVTYTTDSSRSLTIPVSAQIVTDATDRDAGVQFVLLVQTEPDADGNFITEAQDVVQVENGQYTFRFRHDDGQGTQDVDEVRPGSYYLVAGTDLDNDGFICQPGEACAEYPVSGLRQVVQVTADTDLTNLRMTTGFSRPTISAATPDVLPRPDFGGYRLLTRDDPGVKQLSGGRP